ncbi:hypothetical protein [Paenibacillus sp. 1P07SE]
MGANRRKPPILPGKPKEEGNKKAMIVLGSTFAVIVILVSVLIIVS